MWKYTATEELYHHGVKGMRWGRRKAKTAVTASPSGSRNQSNTQTNGSTKKKMSTKKKVAIGAGVAAAALAAFGAYKISKIQKDKKVQIARKADYEEFNRLLSIPLPPGAKRTVSYGGFTGVAKNLSNEWR